MAYIANTADDVREMLAKIGLDSLDQLFDMIPAEFRLPQSQLIGRGKRGERATRGRAM